MSRATGRCPDLRVAITNEGEITAVSWSPALGRPADPASAQARVPNLAGLFDVTIERADTDEIATDVLARDVFVGPNYGLARDRLTAWAVRLGILRLWAGDECVALEPDLLGGTWETTCLHCGAKWSDSSVLFWLQARGNGHTPLSCRACGAALPQLSDDQSDAGCIEVDAGAHPHPIKEHVH